MKWFKSKYEGLKTTSRPPAEGRVPMAIPETHQTASSAFLSKGQDVEQGISGRPQSQIASQTLRVEQLPPGAGDSEIQVVPSNENTSQSSNEDLWDIAYENLRKLDERLVLEFEKSLIKESSPKSTMTSNFHDAKGLKREIQMAELVRERLKAIDNSKWTLKIGRKTVVVQEQMDRLVKVVAFAKDFVGSIVASNPHGAIAWAGV